MTLLYKTTQKKFFASNSLNKYFDSLIVNLNKPDDKSIQITGTKTFEINETCIY